MHDVKQLEIVMRYHEETKHHFNRYARALGYMDWANQPNPFRRYEGATLGRRADCPDELLAELLHAFPPQAFLVGLSSIHWREAWKYGERAFRYCQHDAGHAIATVRIAAATLGWSAVVLHCLADETVEYLLGLNRTDYFAGAEREHPDLVMVVWPTDLARDWRKGDDRVFPLFLDPVLVGQMTKQRWYGKANRLSPDDPVPWEIIDAVAVASRKHSSEWHGLDWFDPPQTPREASSSAGGPSAGRIIHQRRSLLACDGKTSIPADTFYKMLARVVPHPELELLRRPMPWDALPWDPTIHLGLFVHRVDGLDPGLYLLARDPGKVDKLKHAMHKRFAWTTPSGCPPDLPLYLLEHGDAQRLASQVSCFQDIAGEGAFSLGMIAEYQEALFTHGPWFYRRLFWETGVIGQVLYLEAEVAGVRATGIGCFFDDPVHQVFGLQDLAFQSLYHFTVGGPVDDPRLTTLPPYGVAVEGQERGMDLP